MTTTHQIIHAVMLSAISGIATAMVDGLAAGVAAAVSAYYVTKFLSR